MSLKQQKEQFVSDLLGGSISEIYNVTCIALTSYLAYNIIQNFTNTRTQQQRNIPIIYDYILNVLALLASVTLYSDNATTLHYMIVLPGLALYASEFTSRSSAPNVPRKQERTRSKDSQELLPRKAFITAYRAQMLILTSIAILAVDFKIFPRRFAKVETWGTSLMDLGVGSFVFSMGLVNSRSLIRNQTASKSFQLSLYLNEIKHSVIKTTPLLVLGLIRLVSVKKLEYQEHMTEYGIHWNFFITLGMLPIALAVLDPLFQLVPARMVTALAITFGYEILLSNTDLLAFILTSENRFNNIITMNKEGIFSFLGYFAIFVFGQSFGSFVLTGSKTANNLVRIGGATKPNKPNWFTVNTTNGLFISTIFYHSLFYLVNNSWLFTSVSRRLANCAYVLWVVSYNSTMLLGYNLIDKLVTKNNTHSSYLLEAVNNNGLLLFLVANLLTGLVNMSVNTLAMDRMMSFAILLIYTLVFTAIAAVLHNHKVYIKL
ncbi:GPI-anchored wall transfer protein 1 [Spathaspora passalidarum NRRL Y-27907]|uniref:GPI-anchored wall transfer protein n=1 Tax=Spathaspora passalidarum (strain NRRL Y-27907 / 11-Y1) TaxID=619300 RepID=G3AM82_SPAPN|nr:GPI-anchored wall transfer protein 1 [Spathaspora passalidarum NRRL Y-27907]EGW33380.1 GPI-anchored wall transfer protein 1 [Spathaspora passalidarum NRRL Y-27907]